MAKTVQLLIGADPELFIFNPNSTEFISAHDLLPGSKEDPHKVPFGAIQVDGTAAEFNIDPAKNADEFQRNIANVMGDLARRLPGYELRAIPAVHYDPKYFKSIPDSAKELGCDPDYNAWNLGAINPRPDGNQTLRTGSGHVHLGWTADQSPFDPDHFLDCQELVQLCDYYLGLPALLWDTDNTRRSLYGKAGAFRPKSYGVEYRVMSNAWLATPMLQRWVFGAASMAFNKFITKDYEVLDEFGNLAEEIINRNGIHWQEANPRLASMIPVPPAGLLGKKAA
jgi:hypothetical protein